MKLISQILPVILIFILPACSDLLEDGVAKPKVEFEADVRTITPGTTVHFTDKSIKNSSSWLWDFGDGSTSTEQNPSHTYTELGNYTVTLTGSNAGGSDTETIGCFINVFNFGSVTDIEGNTYKTIKIGNQEWMAENLKTTKFNDGTNISLFVSDDESTHDNLSNQGAYCWYRDDKEKYGDKYGALYSYQVVHTGKLSPAGWHVPSFAEMKEMLDYINENDLACNTSLRSGNDWFDGIYSNTFGFSALPAGYYDPLEELYLGVGYVTSYWLKNDDKEYQSYVYSVTQEVFFEFPSVTCLSVRCIKD